MEKRIKSPLGVFFTDDSVTGRRRLFSSVKAMVDEMLQLGIIKESEVKSTHNKLDRALYLHKGVATIDEELMRLIDLLVDSRCSNLKTLFMNAVVAVLAIQELKVTRAPAERPSAHPAPFNSHSPTNS